MMPVYVYRELSTGQLEKLCQRNPFEDPSILDLCGEIFQQVRLRGDQSLSEFTERFDKVQLQQFEVPSIAWSEAAASLPRATSTALQRAASNIARFHSSQIHSEAPVMVEPGVECWRERRAIERVGLYVPGGTAILASTALMLGVPARIAGCREILLCTPPGRNGTIAPEVLAAAEIAGVQRVFSLGGAQAIAALTFGTETVPRVDKIYGPGNRFVQTAKFLAMRHGVAIDALAGPSEVLVIADRSASAALVAADLISQAEHDPESRAILVSTSPELIERVQQQLRSQLSNLPRQDFARTALSRSSCLLVDSLEQAFQFSNRYGPEHLILQIREARRWVGNVAAAGSVFVGPWSPEVAGDYASGTNHVLPTSGMARSTSGVSMDSFVNQVTFQELSFAGLESLGPTLEVLARMEGLEGHARAVSMRRDRGIGPKQPPGSRREDSSVRSFDLNALVRSNILQLEPYRSARDTIQDGLLMDANENPFPTRSGGIELNRYPDPQQRHLRSMLATHLGVETEQVLCGVGSDEVLDWVTKVFCQPGRDAIAITPPTYGMYRVIADVLGVEVLEFPLDPAFDFDGDSFLSRVPPRVKVLILCSPNNPTANLLNKGSITSVCRNWNGIVLVDEAYIEFSRRPSLALELNHFPNLVLMRTFSKAAGRAGIRLGCAIASPQIISYFSKVKTPYNLSSWTMEQGCQVLREDATRTRQMELLKSERQRISEKLAAHPQVRRVYPSETNFILFQCQDAAKIYRALLERRIIIRDRSSIPGLKDCLRVSVGIPRENDRFLHAIENQLEALA